MRHTSVGRPAPGPPGPSLSHLDEQGAARMVDVSAKPVTAREAVARAGKSLEEIEALVDAEIAELAKTPPSQEEINRAVAAIETSMLSRLEKVSTLADTVNSYNQNAGDPDFIGKDLARYRAVTPQSVSAVVAAQLRKDARVVVQTTPGDAGQIDAAQAGLAQKPKDKDI